MLRGQGVRGSLAKEHRHTGGASGRKQERGSAPTTRMPTVDCPLDVSVALGLLIWVAGAPFWHVAPFSRHQHSSWKACSLF